MRSSGERGRPLDARRHPHVAVVAFEFADNTRTMAGTLYDLLPPAESADSDELLGRFLDYVAGKGLTLYPAQEEAVLELFEGKNVILNTPRDLARVARCAGPRCAPPSACPTR